MAHRTLASRCRGALKIVEGEVWLRADSMAAGYWRDGGVQPLVNEQGWFATRDRGEIREGKLTLLGRMDNLFFSGGKVFSLKRWREYSWLIRRFSRRLSCR
jgi:long-subunit acyl-CoA synthetase (AMP-forming)